MGKRNERSFRRMEKELKDLAGRKKEMVLPEEGHLLQTVSLVREAYRTAGARRKPMGFFLFTVRQIRYAGRYVWAWQCLLLFGILTVFCGFTRNWSGADLDLMMFLYRRIPLLLCGAGVASAWSCVPLFGPCPQVADGGGRACRVLCGKTSAGAAFDQRRECADGRRAFSLCGLAALGDRD